MAPLFALSKQMLPSYCGVQPCPKCGALCEVKGRRHENTTIYNAPTMFDHWTSGSDPEPIRKEISIFCYYYDCENCDITISCRGDDETTTLRNTKDKKKEAIKQITEDFDKLGISNNDSDDEDADASSLNTCKGITKTGKPCTRKIGATRTYCFQHKYNK